MKGWRCPKCKSLKLKVSIVTEAMLYQYPEEDNFETEADGDHEWDDSSQMTCLECGYADKSNKFQARVTKCG